MKIEEIGKMVQNLRVNRGISQEELCHGICSVATLSRLEAGERRPNILEFNALLQRIGKSTDHINTVLTIEEFEYFAKRRNIEISISTKDFERAEKELSILEQELEKKGQPLQRQDIYRLHTLLYIYQEKEKEAENYLYKALVETISNFEELKIEYPEKLLNLWLSESEIQLLLLYIYIKTQFAYRTTNSPIQIYEGDFLFLETIIHYIQLKTTDEKLKDKELSMALYLKASFYKTQLLWQNCYECCEDAITMEVKNGTISILFQCMELEMECFGNGVMKENANLRVKEYESLKAVLEQYGKNIPIQKFVFIFENISQEKSLIDEVIRFSRLRSEYSQQELSEGICTPETLSRIETGKRNPTIKNFYALMKKSGIEMGYYNTEFEVKKFETLEKISKMKRAMILKKFKEVEVWLKEIEMEVDMSIIKNQQQIGMCRTVCSYRLETISTEEALRTIEGLLQLTLKKADGKFELPYQPTSVEISLLNQITVYYKKMGQQKQAIEILKSLYKYFNQSKLEAPEHNQRYFMIVTNLSYNLEESGELGEAMDLLEESLTSSIKYNNGFRIGSSLIEKAYIQEKMGSNACLKNYEYGYFLCGLFRNFVNQNRVKIHVCEKCKVTYDN